MKGRSPESKHAINYSFFANHRETMLALPMVRLSSQEWRVVLALLNQTDGYHRVEDSIHLSFWQSITLMSGQSLNHTLKRLVGRGIVLKEPKEGKAYYRLAHPNDWPGNVFAAQRITPKALKQAKAMLTKEKEPHNFHWLDRLLGRAEKVVQSDNVFPPASKLSNQTMALSNQTTPVVQPDNFSDTKKPLESTKESTKESIGSKQAAAPDPRVAELMKAVEKERGWVSHRHAAEAKAVKWMLGQVYTLEDIMGCWRAMLKEPFWQKTPLHMMSVASNIGQWKKGEGHGGEGGPPGVRGGYSEKGRGYRPRVGTDEEFREQALRLGQQPDNPADWGGVPGGGDADPGGPGEGPALGDTGQRPAPGNQGDLPALHSQETASRGAGSG